jgi:hypothetical protein
VALEAEQAALALLGKVTMVDQVQLVGQTMAGVVAVAQAQLALMVLALLAVMAAQVQPLP